MSKIKSAWVNMNKRRGFKKSFGFYTTKPGQDRQFNLIPISGGKAVEYSSPSAAKRDGWRKDEKA